jgi:hypothetical protein
MDTPAFTPMRQPTRDEARKLKKLEEAVKAAYQARNCLIHALGREHGLTRTATKHANDLLAYKNRWEEVTLSLPPSYTVTLEVLGNDGEVLSTSTRDVFSYDEACRWNQKQRQHYQAQGFKTRCSIERHSDPYTAADRAADEAMDQAGE